MGIGKKLNYYERSTFGGLMGPQLIDRLPQPYLQKRGAREDEIRIYSSTNN